MIEDDWWFTPDEPNPPTEKQRKWATENFSSRVDPPIDEMPPLVEPDMVVSGMAVNILFVGHSLVDVPFED